MKNHLLSPRIPSATYRLQLNGNFTFSDVKNIVRYLNELGISDIYTSPYFRAKEGSPHGYDIVDHNTINPDIGSEEQYNELMSELGKYGMGHVLDIVPNHMGISKGNALWTDLLENGPSSIYANFFDVDWDPVKRELKDKILIPILGDQYGTVLENQELVLSFDDGSFFVKYYDHFLPLRPQTYTHILRHNLDKLEKSLPNEDPELMELLSIITALEHLPPYTELDLEKIKERYREKEIIKKRLSGLYKEASAIRAFIDENLLILNGIKGKSDSFDLFDELLSMQAYRLSYWRVATEEINYRRFFDINELAAIRMEDPDVFRETHKLLFKLIMEGKVTGLRADHPDGLYNPSEYFHWLQRICFLLMKLRHLGGLENNISNGLYEGLSVDSIMNAEQRAAVSEIIKQYEEEIADDPAYKPFYIIGEKILLKGERMPEDWPIFSTTGYVFLNSVNGIFIDTANAKAFDAIYSRFIRSKMNYQDTIYEKKKQIMYVAMASEINTLSHYLNRISEKNRHTRDFTLYSLRSVIVEVIAFFPVYRTYITSSGVNDRDRRYIELAISKAKRRNPAISESVFNFLKDVLLLNYPEYFLENDRNEWLDYTMRFQQITGPVMAKGVEDTAFYVYNRFLSLNEVGGSPDRFGIPLETFHGQNIERTKFWPHALIATATHDTKRCEDLRARLNVLSEIPEEWKDCLVRWNRMNKKKKMIVEGQKVPDRNEEYFLYQTLIGAWPVNPMNTEEYETFKTRIKDYMLKAVREAKVNSSWISPNSVYEDIMIVFIDKILDRYPDGPFLKDFLLFQKKISHYGMFNSLSQVLLKITSPGVPDFYQGTELWNFSLVDPDNRRTVDYQTRKNMLEQLNQCAQQMPLHKLSRELTVNRESGAIKLYLTHKALQRRGSNKELFDRGEYIPLEVMGQRSENVCAFARRVGDETALIVAPRLFTKLFNPFKGLPFGEEVWDNSYIVIPSAEEGTEYLNIFTGTTVKAKNINGGVALHLSEVIADFPVALLEKLT